eukprot:COSAG06_NODE_54824_length_292_cov_1.611399_1_plen_54_part_10
MTFERLNNIHRICAGHKRAQDGASWDDLSFVADGLRSVLGPAALLYENDAFHQG